MLGAGVHLPPFALQVDEPAAADDRIGTVGSVPYARMDESKALPGRNIEGLGVVRSLVDHLVMLSLGAAMTPRQGRGQRSKWASVSRSPSAEGPADAVRRSPVLPPPQSPVVRHE
jgi:hypothetical protein